MAKAAKTFCDRCESRVVAGEPFCATCGYPTTWASHDERTAWEVAQYREKSASKPIAKPAGDVPRQRASARTDIVELPKPGRREKRAFGALFGRRRSHAQALVLPEPKRVEPPVAAIESAPSAVLTMVRPEPEPVEVKTEPIAAVAPVAAMPAPAAKPVAPVAKAVAPVAGSVAVAPKPAPRVRTTPRTERPVPARKPALQPKSDGLVSRVERAMNDNEALVDTPATVLAMRMLNQRVRELDEKIQRLERELAATKAAPEHSEDETSQKRVGR
jgi:hypothetical protein